MECAVSMRQAPILKSSVFENAGPAEKNSVVHLLYETIKAFGSDNGNLLSAAGCKTLV